MKDEKIERVLTDLKQRLTALYGERLEQVVLFGSQARGEAGEDSDIDVLVVLKGEVNHTKELEQISFITAELSGICGRLISTVVVSKKDYDARTRIVYDNLDTR